MKESVESSKEYFKYPDIEEERGEFERVARMFSVDSDTLEFLAQEEGRLIPLREDTWSVLENTDSNKLVKGDWDSVRAMSEAQTPIRDWEKLKDHKENDVPIDAPIIMKFNGRYHLIAGNTRLMVARALGITPKVLIFEYKEDRTNEKD